MYAPRHVATSVLICASVALALMIPAAAFAGPALQFVPLAPCRVADTRNPDGPFGGPSIAAGTSRDFPVQQSACNVPSDAVGYSLNITVVPPGPLGFVTVWPSGQPRPLASTLNSYDGRTKANAAIVVAGNNGAISVYASDKTDVVLDINGYFVSSDTTGLAFYALAPCRVLDTRNPNGPLGGPYLTANQPRSFPLLTAPCNIPSQAQAYSLNVTAVPRGPLYFLSVWPSLQAWPGNSTLNAPTGTAVANAAIVPAGSDGGIQALASNDADMLADINGYFAPPGTGGLSLFPTTPCRVLDTRNQQGNFKGELTINVVGSPCGVPSAAQAYVLNATVVPPGPLGFISLWPDGQPQPLVSTLNAYDGAVTSNMALVPTTNGKIDAYASDLTPLILDLSSYFAPQSFLTISTRGLPIGAVNTPYAAVLDAIGGTSPYTWSITQGSLPNGLNLDSNTGAIVGLPTTAGTSSFTVKVQDSVSATATANLSITIDLSGFTITTAALPVGNLNVAYSGTLGATGGTAPYTWSVSSGGLPAGLSLNAATGVISGTPSATGTFPFTVQAQDALGNVASQPLAIIVGSGANNIAISGTYAFSFSGFNATGSARFTAGSFIADGHGNITGGSFDHNASDGGPTTFTITGGNYSIETSGLGVISLTSGTNSNNLAVAVSTTGDMRLIQFLHNDGSGASGSGFIAKQDTTKFSLASLTGPFAGGSTGVDSGLNRFASASAFLLNGSTSLTNGEVDSIDNGVAQTQTFTGTLASSVNPQTGRGTILLNVGNGHLVNEAFYIVSANQFIGIGIDPIQTNPLFIGLALSQSTTSFNNAALNGNGILEATGLDHVNNFPAVNLTLGLFNADGNGNATVLLDQNIDGTIVQSVRKTGTYQISPNGRVVLNSDFGKHPPLFYMVSTNRGFVVGTDNAAIAGTVQPQSGSSFSNASFSGNYLGGSQAPIDAGNDEVDWVASDGNGNLGVTSYSSSQMSPSTFQATYAVDATGRTTINDTTTNKSLVGIGYVVSPTKLVVLTTDISGHLIEVEH